MIRKVILGLMVFLGSYGSGQTIKKEIFNEDFGTSTLERGASQYVPQGGNDASLGGEAFSHGSKFYKLAMPPYKDNAERGFAWNIDNGYYAVIAPQHIYKLEKPAGIWVGNWWKNISDHTNASKDANGAVLVINGGSILNQFYRRAVTLEKNKTYRISAWVFASGRDNVRIQFEAQSVIAEELLGKSNAIAIKKEGTWEKMQWEFKVPDNEKCISIAVALRNAIKADSGNDFYVDDIVLEQVVVPGAPVLNCIDQPTYDEVIKANDDFYPWGDSSYTILENDVLKGKVGAKEFILSGPHLNSTISTIGIWPNGVSIDTTTGQLIIEDGTPFYGKALDYNICNLIGVCSPAKVVFSYPKVLAENDFGQGWPGEKAKDSFGNNLNIFENDRLNGNLFTTLPSDHTFAYNDPNNYFVVDPLTGTVHINVKTPNGQHTFEYTICDSNGLCDTAKVVIVIGNFTTQPDVYNAANLGGQNVLKNDSYFGVEIGANIKDFSVSQVGDKNGIEIKSNGTLTTTNTEPGEYHTQYQIKDKDGKLSGVENVTVFVTGFKAFDDVFTIEKKHLTSNQLFNVFENDMYYWSTSKHHVALDDTYKWVQINDGQNHDSWSSPTGLHVEVFNELTSQWEKLESARANRYFSFRTGEFREIATIQTNGTFVVTTDARSGRYRLAYKARNRTADKLDFSTAYVFITIKNDEFANDICVKPGTLGTPKGVSQNGISTKREQDSAWPRSIPNGFIALESSEKGLVITRTTSAKIETPVEGMLIYDTQDNCVKLYNGTAWSCIKKTCND